MNSAVESVFSYCNTNKLSPNSRKTNYMVVTSPKKQVDINIQNMERKDHIKYLGVFIDKHLRVAKNIVFTHKILNKKKDIPAIFSDFIIPTVDIHSHKTRYATQGNLYRTNTRTDYLTT